MSTATKEFRLPDLGEGLPEAELVQWTVAVGDPVALNQTIAEVETAKAVVELPSPFAGTVSALHAEAGDTLDVGDVIITFDVDAAESDGAAEPDGPAESDVPAPEASGSGVSATPSGETSDDESSGPNLVGYGAAPARDARPRRRPRVSGRRDHGDLALLEAAPHDVLPQGHDEVDATNARPRSTPPVRRLARDLGVDLTVVTGTGREGIVTREDVEAFAAGTRVETASLASPPPSGGTVMETRIPIRGVRKHTAAAMVRSAFTAPHVTVFLTVDVTATSELVAALRADAALGAHRIGVLAVVARAVCLALRKHVDLNSSWDEAAGEIVRHGSVNLGIAAATDRGLVVPNIAAAERLGLPELADAIRSLAETARAGRSAPAELTGGTFTITNVGVFGVDAGTPILNPGEAGILAMGAVQRRPWEHRGEIALRDVMTLALSFDHRLVDGEQGARFLADVGAVLRDPGRAMLFA